MATTVENTVDPSFDDTANALNSLCDTTLNQHNADPKMTLHKPADHASSHPWLSHFVSSEKIEKWESSWHMGNFVIDRTTNKKFFEAMSLYVRVGMHLLYYGSRQEAVLQWKRTEELLKAQSVKMGEEYDTPASVAHIEPFVKSFELESSLHELVEPNPKKYPTFNAFFARAIKPEARPPVEPENASVSSSPADCRLTAFQTLDLATKYWIKGYGFTIDKLLEDQKLAQTFENGSIVIARLAPQDYHRWHSPISGTVEKVYEIPGTYYTVNPQAINEPGTLNVFCQNKRSVMLVRHESTGSLIAIVAVGAMLVGSIKYVDGCDAPGTQIKRGQCLGAFYYGGSTVIVLYPHGEILIDKDLEHNSTMEKCETLVKVGWRVGAKP